VVRLSQLVLLVTDACPWGCSYCYLDCQVHGSYMSRDVALAAIEMFDPAPEGMVIQLSGGEPMLARELVWEIAERASARAGVRVAIQSSGYSLGMKELVRLKELGVGIGISLDGMPSMNDRARARGAGDVALRALALASKAGVVVSVTSVLTRTTLPGVVELVAMCGGMQSVGVLNLDLLRPVGRARVQMLPEANELRLAMTRVAEAVEFINSRRWPPLGVRELMRLRRASPGPYCAPAAGKGLCVSPDGRLYPCPSLVGLGEFELGSVEQPHLERLEELAEQWRWPRECEECELLSACRGGCPVRRMVVAGDISRHCTLECALYKGLARRAR